MNPRCPALLVSAPASGQGKTTVVAALARLLVRRGARVRVFKCGPDFLDPFWHERASGQPVHNLDLWLTGEADARARLQGVTLSGAHRVGAVNLSASLDLQRPRNADTGKLLARRAQRLLKLAADTRVADWTLGAEWQAVSHRWDNAANTKRLGGYGLVNLYASTRIARQWDLLARIDNLGDKAYQLAGGYATPPRSFFVGLRWTGR